MVLLEQVRVVQRFLGDFSEDSCGISHLLEFELNHRPLSPGILTQGKYEEAEPMYCRAIEIMETTLGTGHPQFPARLCLILDQFEKQVGLERSGWIKLAPKVWHRNHGLDGNERVYAVRVMFRARTRRRSRCVFARLMLQTRAVGRNT